MIIGLTGRAGVGKDTVGAYLVENFPGLTISGSFAWPIKAALSTMFPSVDFDDRATKEIPQSALGDKSPRFLAQTLGTEWGRNLIHPDIWILSALSRLSGLPHDHLVFTDVRFNNEAEWIISNGGEIWRIVRDSTPDVEDHPSEHGILLDFISRTVYNNGSIAELYSTLDDIIQGYQPESVPAVPAP